MAKKKQTPEQACDACRWQSLHIDFDYDVIQKEGYIVVLVKIRHGSNDIVHRIRIDKRGEEN